MQELPKDILGLILNILIKREQIREIASLSKTCSRLLNITNDYANPIKIINCYVEQNKTFIDKTNESAALKLLVRNGTKWPSMLVGQIYLLYPGVLDSYLPVHDELLRHILDKKTLNFANLVESYYINVVENNGIRKAYTKASLSSFAGLGRLSRVVFSNKSYLQGKTTIDRRINRVTPLYLPSLANPNLIYIYDHGCILPSRYIEL